MKLKIFTHLGSALENIPCEPIVSPFCSQFNCETANFLDSIYAPYIKHNNSFFQKAPLEKSDLTILPVNWEKALTLGVTNSLVDLIEKTKNVDNLSVGFFGGDCSHLRLETESNLMFRHSLYASTKSKRDFAYPAWSKNIPLKYLDGKLPIKSKKSLKPIVGFCGFSADKDTKTYIKYFLYQGEKKLDKRKVPRYHIGHVFRTLALEKLAKSSLIESNFIIRNKSFFQNQTSNSNLQTKHKNEFVQNLIESDYIFCCRGSGNYSFRFYEALSYGRIPVFLNTDCVLPYDFEIDWKKYCVWIEEDRKSVV